MTDNSPFQLARRAYVPRLPPALARLDQLCVVAERDTTTVTAELAAYFPHTAAQPLLHFKPAAASTTGARQALHASVVFSGGPAPGGHNVLWGLLDGLLQLSGNARLTGFTGGPAGILADRARPLDRETLADLRNTGGFDALGTGRTKLTTVADFQRCRAVLEAREIDVLVVIGGDDSNTNAAQLAEYLLAQGSTVGVLGVPKTIDGDLKGPLVEASFGFDTAVKVYAEMIANIARDAISTRKYYHFVRLMGRAASHITLEAALATQPNLAIISEEVAARGQSLRELIGEIADLIVARAERGCDFGVILVPEGLIEFIPEMKALIAELNAVLVSHREFCATLSGFTEQSEFVLRKLSRDCVYAFTSLPIDIQRQLLMERDPHGNVVVSQVETEKLLIELLVSHLAERKAAGAYAGNFGFQRHFLGYEGRCAAPTNFDADYAYSLGHAAAALAGKGVTGYLAAVTKLSQPRAEWQAVGVPLVSLMTLENRGGRPQPVIRKALVDLDGNAFRHFAAVRGVWAQTEAYRFVGSIQYFGPETLVDAPPIGLVLEQRR